jgi:hypothetical protein
LNIWKTHLLYLEYIIIFFSVEALINFEFDSPIFFYIFWKIGLINSILITIMISQNFVLLVEIQSMFWIWLRYRCSMSFSELSIQPYRFYKVQVAKNQHRLNKYIHFDFERTWWSLFQKRVVRTKLYIYVFITITGRYLCRWTIIPEGLIHPVASVST